jgi:iron complex transport system ATP-binding protein
MLRVAGHPGKRDRHNWGRRMPPIIELANLTSMRGGVRVLHDISLSVAPGEHTAILGPNGAGKSSLMRLLMLEDRPLAAEGQPPLQLFGRATWDLMELRKQLGVVTGDLDANFGWSTSRGRVRGIDVALSGLFGSQGVFSNFEVTTAMRQQATEALERVEASHLAAKPLNEMSTGERRRVLIARALVTRPEALLLDEPTTGLDLVARHRFMESVRALARGGTTIIIVTHHAEEIVPEIGRVVLLRHGRVAFDGPAEAALTGESLGTVYGAPVVVTRSAGYFHVRLA